MLVYDKCAYTAKRFLSVSVVNLQRIMNKLLLFLSFIGLLSCQPEDQPTDVAARASGRFAVQSYVVNGDTLYTSSGINKIGVSEFFIAVDRKKPDSVRVGSVYKKIGDAGSIDFAKVVGVRETNGTFQLVAPSTVSSAYESSIDGNSFYERTSLGKGGGIIVLAPSYVLKKPIDPAQEGVFISAKK